MIGTATGIVDLPATNNVAEREFSIDPDFCVHSTGCG